MLAIPREELADLVHQVGLFVALVKRTDSMVFADLTSYRQYARLSALAERDLVRCYDAWINAVERDGPSEEPKDE